MKIYSYDELLNLLETDFQIDSQILSGITGFPKEFIENPDGCTLVNNQEKNPHCLMMNLMEKMAHLVAGFSADEDTYVREHMHAMRNLGLTTNAMAKFMSISEDVLNGFIENSLKISDEDKNKIAVRFLSLEWLLTKNPNIKM